MGRRTALASLAGEAVEKVPGQSAAILMSLALDKVVPTRFNPRRRFGTEEELREFGKKLARKQLQPAVVVSRAAYLKLWPEEAEHLGTASHVIVNGERRYRASALVGRPTLEVVLKEDLAANKAVFLDAVQSENNDRQNLDPIERALGIDIMVTELGGANKVAVYYEKSDGWVSQQRKLLKLTPVLQDLVSVGEMPVRVARDIAGLPADVQAKAWESELERRRLDKEAAVQLRAQAAERTEPPASVAEVSRFTAVKQPAAVEPEAPSFTAVKPDPPRAETPAVDVTEGDRLSEQSAERSSGPADYHGVIITDPEAGTTGTAPESPADPDHQTGAEVIPTPRTDPAPEVREGAAPEEPVKAQAPKLFPYHNGTEASMHLLEKMLPRERAQVVRMLSADPETQAALAQH